MQGTKEMLAPEWVLEEGMSDGPFLQGSSRLILRKRRAKQNLGIGLGFQSFS